MFTGLLNYKSLFNQGCQFFGLLFFPKTVLKKQVFQNYLFHVFIGIWFTSFVIYRFSSMVILLAFLDTLNFRMLTY